MNAPFSIRPVTELDAAAIAQLSSELGYPTDSGVMRERLSAVLASDTDLLIAAVDSENLLAGWLQAHAARIIESGFRVEITGLAVSSAARRCGAGRMLVNRAEEWAKGLGAGVVVVRSNVNRVESHLFYPALGYTISKTQKVYRKSIAPEIHE